MDESFAERLDRETLRVLSERSDAKGLFRLASHFAALAALAVLIAFIPFGPWLLPALAVYGVLLIFLFAPLHECIHRTAFRARWLNDAVAPFAGTVLILPPGYFREFHFAHHRHTQDEANDPELLAEKPQSLAAYLWLMTGLPYWRERISTTLRHAFTGRIEETFIAERKRGAIRREAVLYVLFYAAVIAASAAAGSSAIVWYWLAPALLGQPALRVFLLAEHGNCPRIPDMLKNSRTTTSNALVRWFAWNMPYHAEHHAYPGLPFHALAAAHTHLAPAIDVRAKGYLAMHWGYLRWIGK